jgi:cytochrome c556
VAALAIAGIAADAPPQPDRVAVFMRAKLGHAEHVLEGLAVADYELIERAAQELSLASLDSNWQVLQTEDYVRQSAEFRRACDSLKKAAQEKNLDGATLAWVDVTLKCVQCHKYVRDAE